MKEIIITGASSGIGAATARLLGGHRLILVGRNAERLEAVAREAGGRAIVADLTDASGLESVAAAVDNESGDRVIVHAAGIAHFGDTAEMPWDTIENQIEINFVAPLRLTHLLLPWLLAGSGQVVNVLSIAATNTFPGAAGYCGSKTGLLAAMRSLSAEYRKQGLRITNVIPGATDTPLWEGGSFVPERKDMLTAEAVALCIADVIHAPADRNFDEITLMPPKGIL